MMEHTQIVQSSQSIGVVAGSLDPITFGHEWLVREACSLVDKLYVVIGINAAKAKTRYFTPDESKALVESVLKARLPAEMYKKIEVVLMVNDLLINFASEVGAKYLFRGIRNTEDFNYEYQMQLVNRKINPHVHTVFLIPPPHLTEVSSSTVKGLVGFRGWEAIVSKYVHQDVLRALKAKVAARVETP